MTPRILVKGAGEHATGTAHRLFQAGYQVVMTEIAEPTAVRRTVAFCAAIAEGEITVEGVRAVAYHPGQAFRNDRHIPVLVDPRAEFRLRWRPHVIVDGRIMKRNLDNSAGDAELVIGLGPGLEAGRDVHAVIETQRGHDLGRIIRQGFAARNTGTPGEIAGRGIERILRAPASGPLEALGAIGDHVEAGEVVATVSGAPVRAAIGGVLRGLAQPGLFVREGQKIGDVDPRDLAQFCRTISDKARTISGAVLEVVLAAGYLPAPDAAHERAG